MLSAYHWPGNIRELLNVTDFACAVASDPEVGIDDLPDQVFTRAREAIPGSVELLPADMSEEAAILRQHLAQAQWNVSAAARLLGIDRTTLHRRMRRLGVTLRPRAT